MEYVLLWLLLSFIVGIIGSGKTIGFFFALLLSLLFSPIIGLIIVAFSESKETKRLRKLVEVQNKQQNYKTDAEILKENSQFKFFSRKK